MALLELNDIHTYYGNIEALKGISLTVEEGEVVTLIGSNGAGKSTTLRSISGLTPPREGSIRFEDREIGETPPRTSSGSASRSRPRGATASPACRCARTSTWAPTCAATGTSSPTWSASSSCSRA